MNVIENVLVMETDRRRMDRLMGQIAGLDFNVAGVVGIPAADSDIPNNGSSVIMVHDRLLQGAGVSQFRKLMGRRPDSAIIFTIDDESRMGALNNISDKIYDYLVLPASDSYISRALDISIDRRARLLLEKYYQQYLELQVSQQKRLLADQQVKLIHQDRLSSLGQVSAGIIHELNNPLMYMKLNLETLENILDETTGIIKDYGTRYPDYKFKNLNAERMAMEIPNLVESITKGFDRIERILGNIRKFSRKPEEMATEFDLHQAISNALNFAKGVMKTNIDIRLDLEKQLPHLKGDPQKLEQIFLNLFINGAHALEDEAAGVLWIKTEKVNDNSKLFIKTHVNDNGSGIPKEIIDSIFDPFFTTKSSQKGTGLGLSICREIAAEFSGVLEVESEVGKGTTFTLSLPVTE